MLSQTSEYALRAVLFLADHEGEGPVKIERIAEALSLPRNYLSKTLHQLAQAGILRSERGPYGGFRLATSSERLTLAEIVAPFDPSMRRRQCLLGRPTCSDENPCPAHARWKGVSQQVASFFHATTVADLLRGEAPAGPGRAVRGEAPGEP